MIVIYPFSTYFIKSDPLVRSNKKQRQFGSALADHNYLIPILPQVPVFASNRRVFYQLDRKEENLHCDSLIYNWVLLFHLGLLHRPDAG